MMMSAIEIRLGGFAAMLLPRQPGMLGGPTPDEISVGLHQLRALIAAEPHVWATEPLELLLLAAELGKREAEAVSEGSEALRQLGLHDLAARGRPGHGEMNEYLDKFPSGELMEVLHARLVKEHPPIPEWIYPAMTVGEVQEMFGSPDDEMLDEMGAVNLSNRLDSLEALLQVRDDRLGWYRKYQYPPSYAAEEMGVWEALGTRRRATSAAFERSDIPETWNAPTIPRRMMDRIALGNPPLAMDMMTGRVPSVKVVDPTEGDDT